MAAFRIERRKAGDGTPEQGAKVAVSLSAVPEALVAKASSQPPLVFSSSFAGARLMPDMVATAS
jgi:hypothetical protein